MIDFNRYQAEMIKNFKDKYCLIPGCKNKKIIKAHTVQKKGGLSSIARDGVVYTFKGFGKNYLEILQTKDRLKNGFSVDGKEHYWPEPDKIGINSASTITAFCSQHDRDIFAPIELEQFIPTEKQIRLYALRCFAYELNKKNASAKEKTNRVMKKYINNEKVKSLVDIHTEGSRISEDVVKKVFLNLLEGLEKESSLQLDYVLFKLDKTPEIVCSFSRFINMDLDPLNAKLVQNRDLQWISCSCFSKDNQGYVLISWDKKHDKPREFVQLLLANTDTANIIANMFFYCAENVFFSPVWWDSLSISKKIAIEKEIIELAPDLRLILSNTPKKIIDWKMEHSSNCGL